MDTLYADGRKFTHCPNCKKQTENTAPLPDGFEYCRICGIQKVPALPGAEIFIQDVADTWRVYCSISVCKNKATWWKKPQNGRVKNIQVGYCDEHKLSWGEKIYKKRQWIRKEEK